MKGRKKCADGGKVGGKSKGKMPAWMGGGADKKMPGKGKKK